MNRERVRRSQVADGYRLPERREIRVEPNVDSKLFDPRLQRCE
jgi:hypothetical protein